MPSWMDRVDELERSASINILDPPFWDAVSKMLLAEVKNVGYDRFKAGNCNDKPAYCGRSFKRDELLYHCSDCALDETCVLCEDCFNFDIHKGHRFWYSICTESNGSCDCGEEDSWKCDLGCAVHQRSNCETDQPLRTGGTISADQEQFLNGLISYVFATLIEFCTQSDTSAINPPFVLLLFNDEKHSYEDVIQILTSELSLSNSEAFSYASLVDKQGFAPIFKSDAIGTCERIGRKISGIGLETSVCSETECRRLIIASTIFHVLKELCDEVGPLRLSILKCMLHDFDQIVSINLKDVAYFAKNQLELYYLLDHKLWKGIRRNFHELLNMCNSVELDMKKQLAASFCNLYGTMFEFYWKEKREPQWSICHFSVQLFTLTPVAEHCCRETNILGTIFGRISTILDSGYKDKLGLKVQAIRQFDYTKFSVLLHDGLHLLGNIKDYWLENVASLSNIESFCYCLYLLSHMEKHVRKTDRHVLYDRDNFDQANYICFEIMKIAKEFVKFIVLLPDLSVVWPKIEHFILQSEAYKYVLVQSESDSIVPAIFAQKQSCSFFGPFTWFWGMLINESICQDKFSSMSIPSRLMKTFALDALRRLVFAAEVRANLWIRNGSIILQQEYFYSQTVFHNLTYIQDVYACCIGAKFFNFDYYFNLIYNNSGLVHYLDDINQHFPIIEQILIVLYNVIHVDKLKFDAGQILINALCVEPSTRSELVHRLPECVSDNSGFKSEFFRLSKLVSSASLGKDAKYDLNPDFSNHYDPFYWAMTMHERIQSWENLGGSTRFDFDKCLKFQTKLQSSSDNTSNLMLSLCFIATKLLDAKSSKVDFSLSVCAYLLVELNNDLSSLPVKILEVQEMIKRSSFKSLSEFLSKHIDKICKLSRENQEPKRGPEASEKRRLLMNRLKLQRQAYLSDESGHAPPVSYELSKYCCVLCSESVDSVENQFHVPVQITSSGLVRFVNQHCLFEYVKGCCHVMHEACWKSLPPLHTGRRIKKCPLCASPIDVVIPAPKSELVLAIPSIKSINFSQMLEYLAVKDSQSNSLAGNLELYRGLVYDVMCFVATGQAVEIIPAQTLCTLNSIRIYLLLDEEQNLGFFSSLLTSSESSFFDDCTCVVYFAHELAQKHVSDVIFSSIMQFIMLKLQKFTATSSETYLKCVQILKYLLSLLSTGTLEALEVDFDSLENAELILTLVPTFYELPAFSANYQLFSLPYRYDEILKTFLRAKCENCCTIPRSPAICLVCGIMVCAGDSCCRKEFGECNIHRERCSGAVGLFLLVRTAALLLLTKETGALLPAPYTNCFGEHDLDLKSDFALFLHRESYHDTLQPLWLNHEIRDFIYRNYADIRPNGATLWGFI